MGDEIQNLSFEEAMEQLERIVRDLESGKGKLDEAVDAYDRGMRLRRHCEAKLTEAQAKIDKIIAGPGGALGTEPLNMPNLKRRSGLLERLMSDVAADVDRTLDRLLPDGSGEIGEVRLAEAMRYMTLGGGKRFRAFLTVESSRLFRVSLPAALQVAAAVEMLHTYSLIHDDLPAMDNAALRRGRPTVHRMYDEATAILAGDALLARAFEVLADPAVHGDPAVRIELVKELAQAAGVHGMCGGQMMDLQAETEALPLEIGAVIRLQRLKTGMIVAFSCEAGAILGKAAPTLRHALNAYAHDLGLAFQIADDLLDIEGSSREMGKETGKDSAANKATFVSILGSERARMQAQRLADQACRHLEVFEDRASPLREVARFVIERKF